MSFPCVPKCPRPARWGTYCDVHSPIADRLWRTSRKRGECWEWTAGVNSSGYGVVRWGGRQWYVHRLAYHSLVSYLHKDVVVHHRCANRRCWRPEHLQATTAHANTAEMLSRRDLERTIRLTAQELHEVREDFLAVVEDAISLERERDLLIARLDRAHDIADALAAGNPASGPTQTPEGF